MKAQLEIIFSEDSNLLMMLDQALLEELPQAYSLHDINGLEINIDKKDIIDYSHDEITDEFQLQTQGTPITIRVKWEEEED